MYQLIVLTVVILLAGCTEPTAPAAPFDFKGVPLGANEQALLSKVKVCHYNENNPAPCTEGGNLSCRKTSLTERPNGDRRCASHSDSGSIAMSAPLYGIEYAGVRASHAEFYFIEDRLMGINVTLHEFQFASVTDALIQKYGKPQVSEKKQSSNRFGATVQGDYFEWKRGGTTIKAWQHYRTLNESSIQYFPDSYLALVKQRREELAGKAAKNL